MANATPAATRAGWEIFKQSGFKASRESVNQDLQKLALAPISDRTHRHYRQLASAGYDHYVAINRFDVARSSRPFEDESARSRYLYRSVGVPVRLQLSRKDIPIVALGVADGLSEVGAYLTVQQPDAAGLRDLVGMSTNFGPGVTASFGPT